ncbi:MAG: LysE family translocator [Hyphomicrobiales bacterium]|nr:LysE family translocator [Hyphomicrobiales bacterium]MCY4052487.1 LysE family translocator [Hyphomicrobiales bacterium]
MSSIISWEIMTALLLFAFTATWTPGPNNILLASSGARFGFRRSLPLVFGIACGFPPMVFCIAIGLGELFQAQPWIQDGVRIVGALVLLWICWKIVSIPFPTDSKDESEADKPWGFWKGAGFQWINPKSWAAALAIVSAYSKGEHLLLEALLLAFPFVCSTMTSAPSWALFGSLIRGFLNTPMRFRVYNVVMGGLMGLSGLFLFLDV